MHNPIALLLLQSGAAAPKTIDWWATAFISALAATVAYIVSMITKGVQVSAIVEASLINRLRNRRADLMKIIEDELIVRPDGLLKAIDLHRQRVGESILAYAKADGLTGYRELVLAAINAREADEKMKEIIGRFVDKRDTLIGSTVDAVFTAVKQSPQAAPPDIGEPPHEVDESQKVRSTLGSYMRWRRKGH